MTEDKPPAEPVYTLAEAGLHLAEKFCRVMGHDLRIVLARDNGRTGTDPDGLYCGRCYQQWTATPTPRETT